jgi:hypothetical protein
MKTTARAALVLVAGFVLGVALGLGVEAIVAAWQHQAPSSDAWLTALGAALGALLAVLGAYLVGRATAREEASLALDNAMAVLREERAAQRAGDQESLARTEATSFRLALVDLAEECRRWLEADPRRDANLTVKRLLETRLDLVGMRGFLEFVQLPAEVRRYLIWSISHLRVTNEEFQQSLHAVAASIGGARVDNDKWWGIVDRLQVMACLLIAEAKRRGQSDIVATFEDDSWFAPLPGADREREIAELQNPARFGAPPWPSDAAYARCAPTQRDTARQVEFPRSAPGPEADLSS